VVEVFRMLSHTTRVRLLWALADREQSVGELAERVGKSGPSVSQHLAKLRMARLVRTRREGAQVFYRLENEHVRQLVTDAVYNAEHAAGGVPAHHLDDAELRVAQQLNISPTCGGAVAGCRHPNGCTPASLSRAADWCA
jgi:DNA-binding transcriptional ArsR family regulator